MNILPMGEDKLGFRPERVQLGTQRLEGAPFVRKGHILTREMLGSDTTYKIQMGDEAIMVKSPDDTFQYDQDVVLSVRADTHRGNLAMRGLMRKCGYALCGEVRYDVTAGDPIRVAYEKLI